MNERDLVWLLIGICLAQLFYAIMDRLSWRSTLADLEAEELSEGEHS